MSNTKYRKPNFEPSTVPVRNGDYQAWLELVFSTAKDAGERQMRIDAEKGSAAERLEAARARLRKTVNGAKKRRGGEGDGGATA